MRGIRALLAAVIVMGVMIALGTATLIAVVVGRMTHRPPHAAALALPVAGAAVPVLALGEPPGTRIASVARQSDTLLAVTLTGGGVADRLLIWDIASGRVIATLTLSR
jgi:hypothetical protein